MNEIERKVDMLISGMKIPQKRTRRRVATIVASVLIAMTLIASASLITTYYYEQTATDIDVKSAIIITDPDLVEYETPWQEDVTLVGPIQAGSSLPYIYPEGGKYYTITNNADTSETVYIYIDITETPVPPGIEGEGLTVTVYDLTNELSKSDGGQIILGPGASVNFEIHVTADKYIDGTSTYGYIITMEHANS